jgi:hypothetical protein
MLIAKIDSKAEDIIGIDIKARSKTISLEFPYLTYQAYQILSFFNI